MRGDTREVALFGRLLKARNAELPALTVLLARRFVAEYPTHGLPWLFLGIALAELARYQEAEQALRKSIRLLSSRKKHFALVHLGHLFKQKGDFPRAAHWYKKVIASTPDDTDGYIYLGGLLGSQGLLNEAEKVHRRATKCGEGCVDEAFLNLGLVLRAQERFEEAAQSLHEAICLDPNFRNANAFTAV